MPEHEIAKHTKEIYKAWSMPGVSIKHKVIEILIEIAIIVFAITLSLFVERWREQIHDRKIESQFLKGLKKDLSEDLIQLKEDSLSYVDVLHGWSYLRNAGINNLPLDKDSVAKYQYSLGTFTDFIPNDSRFEALKSSGELTVLEDDSLENLILDLYQNRIKSMLSATGFFTKFHTDQMMPFVLENAKVAKPGYTNLDYLIRIPRMQNYFIMANGVADILNRYHKVMEQSRQIIHMIDQGRK